MNTDLLEIAERLQQLNRYTGDDSHWVARIEVDPHGLPFVSFFREMSKDRPPEFLRPRIERKP